jgi:hypothetical protein
MKKCWSSLVIGFFFCVPAFSGKTMNGTWCIEQEGLTITFAGKDSLTVSSTEEDGVTGKGSYTMSDSIFSATVANEELSVKLGYRYAWQKDSTINAKQIYFIVDKDTAENNPGPVTIRHCGNRLSANPVVSVGSRSESTKKTNPSKGPSCPAAAKQIGNTKGTAEKH